MTESSKLIDSLLYQSESTALDFKKEQYPFSGADEEQKSELLKDILAFANSWRQGDAYIVIGVEAVVGGRHIPRGTEDHFDDAQIQQFVNFKTNRRVEFSYEVHLFEGKKIGIIKIPQQERPTYVTKKFGKVEKDTVYYRLGSSTTVAKPNDIARMGGDSNQSPLTPLLTLQFADLERHVELGSAITLNSIAYEKTLMQLPDATDKQRNSWELVDPLKDVNRDYWRDKEEYVRLRGLVKPVGLVIRNQSSTLAEKVRVEIVSSLVDGITVINERDLPCKPVYRRIDKISATVPTIRPRWREETHTDVKLYSSQWSITVSFGKIQPKSLVWATEPFYIGSMNKDYLEFEAAIYADNLPEPQQTMLKIKFAIEKKSALTMENLRRSPPLVQ